MRPRRCAMKLEEHQKLHQSADGVGHVEAKLQRVSGTSSSNEAAGRMLANDEAERPLSTQSCAQINSSDCAAVCFFTLIVINRVKYRIQR